MEAGRELDALIATCVMDWRVYQSPKDRNYITIPWIPPGAYYLAPPMLPKRNKRSDSTNYHPNIDDIEIPKDDQDGKSIDIGCVPKYSTDIAAAYGVEDHIERHDLQGAYVQALLNVVDGDARIFYSAIECDAWRSDGDGVHVAWKLAHATPKQRCLAALKAVGIEVPQ